MKVAWLIPQGEEDNWSSALRLRRLSIAEYLQPMLDAATVIRGYQEGAFGSPEDVAASLATYDVVVLAEQSEFDYRVMCSLRSRGSGRPALVRDHCEDAWEFPWERECFHISDRVVCSSDTLARKAGKEGFRAEVIHEHYERANVMQSNGTLKAGYMGTDGPLAAAIREVGQRAGWDVEILCRPEYGIPGSLTWTEDGWRERFAQYRVLLCPQRPHLVAKSPAKVVQAIGNGMPVLASNTVESYQSLVRHGQDGLLVGSTTAAWERAFATASSQPVYMHWRSNLLDSPVVKSHSLHSIAKRWLTLFCQLAAEER